MQSLPGIENLLVNRRGTNKDYGSQGSSKVAPALFKISGVQKFHDATVKSLKLIHERQRREVEPLFFLFVKECSVCI